MAKGAPPKRARKKVLPPAKAPRAKRPPKHHQTPSERAEKARRASARENPNKTRKHLRTEWSADEVQDICDLISGEVGPGMALATALRQLGIRRGTFRARMDEDKELAAAIHRAQRYFYDDLVDPGAVMEEARLATNKENAPAVKVRLHARFTLAEHVDPDKWGKRLNLKGDVTHRITGLGELLKEISDAGGDVGVGPSRGV